MRCVSMKRDGHERASEVTATSSARWGRSAQRSSATSALCATCSAPRFRGFLRGGTFSWRRPQRPGKTEAILAPLVARTLNHLPVQGRSIRMLLIAPTRALVNDLAARLDGPLGRLGLACGRQTSDHRGKSRRPFVLITTPESLRFHARAGRAGGGRKSNRSPSRGVGSRLRRRSTPVRWHCSR